MSKLSQQQSQSNSSTTAQRGHINKASWSHRTVWFHRTQTLLTSEKREIEWKDNPLPQRQPVLRGQSVKLILRSQKPFDALVMAALPQLQTAEMNAQLRCDTVISRLFPRGSAFRSGSYTPFQPVWPNPCRLFSSCFYWQIGRTSRLTSRYN